MRKLTIILALTSVFLCNGCALVGLLGTKTNYEKKIAAEYDLTKLKEDQRILVLVNQPGWLGADANLRYYLTEAITKDLTSKISISAELIISYDELSQFRSKQPAFSLLSPIEVGKAMNADLVLLVTVGKYQLQRFAETGYSNGFLAVGCVLLDAAADEKLWPESEKEKAIAVGFEVEVDRQQAGLRRLAKACAYCITRYLYNCPKTKFKIADDRSGIAWTNWK